MAEARGLRTSSLTLSAPVRRTERCLRGFTEKGLTRKASAPIGRYAQQVVLVVSCTGVAAITPGQSRRVLNAG